MRTLLVLFAALVACGGQSIRHVEEGAGGEPDDPPPRGGAPNGGKGGSGAGDPAGGTGTFTGGSFTGGTGGVIIGGTGGTGGSIAVGGTGAFGTGGDPGVGGCTVLDKVGVRSGLQFGPDGVVPPGSNPYGISGNWYSFDDCADASLYNLTCTKRADVLLGPDGLPGWTIQQDLVCARGIAPRVELGPDGAPAYGLQWGFGLGLSLNQGLPWDAASRCIRGFLVDIGGNAPATLRINVVTPKTVGISHFVEVPLGPNAVVDFTTIRQGFWVTTQTPLDTTQITDLQFHVYTNEQAPVPYDFCVYNIRPVL
jgi:hypothetical protein